MRVLRIVSLTVLSMVAVVGLAFAFLQTAPGKHAVASILSDVLSAPRQEVRIVGIDGFVPTDLRVARIEVGDRAGRWLQVEEARLVWSFASLLGGRLRIEQLSAARIEVGRPPHEDHDETSSGGGGIRLPFDVDLEALRIDDLHLAAALGGLESHWRISGSASLARDLGEMRTTLTADRTEGPAGRLVADVRLERTPRLIAAEIVLDEDRGGMIAALLQRPDLPEVSLRLVARGDVREGDAEFSVRAGREATASGVASSTARWRPQDGATGIEATLEAGPVTAWTQDVSWVALRAQASGTLDSIRLDGKVEGLTLATLDPRLPQPGDVSLTATLGLRDGKVVVPSFEVGWPLALIRGSGEYALDPDKGEIRATVDLPSLAPLSAIAGRTLTGRARVDMTAGADKGALNARWQGAITEFGAPDVPPGLIATVDLAGTAVLAPDGAWSMRDVRIGSDGGTLTVQGRGRGHEGTLDLALDLPRLAALRADVAGAATASARIGFGGADTTLALKVETREVAWQGIAAPRLSLDTTASLTASGAIGGTLQADGEIAGQALSLRGRFSHDAAGGLVVPDLQGRWANAVLDVTNLAIAEARTTGHARLRIAELKDIAALAEAGLQGSLTAEVTADPQQQGRLDIVVKGADLAAGGVAVGGLDLTAQVDDPMGMTALEASLKADGLRGAGGLSSLRATAAGDRSGLALVAQASGADLAGNLEARIEPTAEEVRIALAKFSGRWRDIPVTLAAPTRIAVVGSRIAIDPTTLRVGAGRIALRGRLDPQASDLQAELAGLPLALIDSLAPGTGIDGTLQAKVHATGAISAPRLEATYSATGLRLRRPAAALLPALSLQGSGTLVGQQASFDARLAAGSGTNLTVRGTATLPRGAAPLQGRAMVGGALDLAPFAPLLGNDIRNVAGRLRPNVTIALEGTQVKGDGTIDFEGGAVALPESGLRLSNGQGRLALQGDVLRIERLAFRMGTGSLTVGGTMRLEADGGLGLDLDVASQRALLVSRPDLVATVTSRLKVAGSTDAGLDISGPVTVDRAEIAVGGGETASFPTLDVREINKPGGDAPPPRPARVAQRKPPPSPTATPIRLAIDVNAPQAVFVRGRGLDAEMGGQIKVGGSPAAPSAIGGLTVRRGTFSLGSRRLTFSKGIVSLDNLDSIDPRLDFLASTSVQSATIGVAITGTSRAPALTITSSPAMPPDEAMALLIFGKPASELGASELLQVAQAVAELTGKSPGEGVLARLRRGLGLDQLSMGSAGQPAGGQGASGANAVSLEAGRYVAPGVYVGARQGAAGNSSRGVVQIEVLDNLKLEGDIGANSQGRVGAKMEWDY